MKSTNVLNEMHTILEFISDGIYIVDQSGKTIYVNKAYEDISGFSRDELIGKHMKDLTEAGYVNQSVSLLVLERKEEISLIQQLGKQKKDVIVTGNPIFTNDEKIKYVITSVRDITQLNELKNKLQRAEKFSEIQNYRYIFDLDDTDKPSILYNSSVMHNIVKKVEQIAEFPTNVLITGPSGVGKEEIANLIHYLSNRKEKPIIKVNCTALPDNLLESELFGYEPGAFTGANKEGKIGLLELANEGTFLLDEIGEMPVALQVKLLRVIQEKEVQRIGSTKSKRLNIRFISATNQDLTKKVQNGSFREDLYYRLKVVELTLPPLKDRREDIEPLANHFFHALKKKFRVDKEMAPSTKSMLQAYDWPGNVRELRNVIENVLVSVPDYTIRPEHLPSSFIKTNTENETPLKDRVKSYEKVIIEKSIQEYGSIRKAAKALNVHHSTLVKKIKSWDEEVESI